MHLLPSFAFLSFAALASAQTPVWGQCGGIDFTGEPTCAAGSTCVYSNEWYSQCIPSGDSSSSTTSSRATTSRSVSSTRVTTTAASTTVAACTGSPSFGFTTGSGYWIVNTGAQLSYRISNSNCDLTSLTYKGTELLETSAGYSQIGSGLGSISASITTINNQYIKITCNHANLIHYYVAKACTPTIFMATYGKSSPTTFEMRYLVRLKNSLFPSSRWPQAQRLDEGTIVEGADVNRLSNGETRSKFYSGERFIENQVFGAYGSTVGAFFVVPEYRYESSSGGPFFRDINIGAGSWMGITHYMNSAHLQTEAYRDSNNLHGPYAFMITPGSTPSANQDLEFFKDLSISGFIPKTSRGYVKGTVSGVPSGFQTVVAWKNTVAQYWTIASGGAYTSPPMKPGTYTMTLFKEEKAVATSTITISSGQTATANIASAESTRSIIWRIGDFDGQPFELKNGDKFLRMHPSDYRMSSWTGSYAVGSAVSNFPMAVFKDVNNPVTITFTLTSSQTGARTLRIGTTVEYAGGRPMVKVNSWQGSGPSANPGIASRSVTRGGYRGFGYEYLVNIPSGTLVAGSNTIQIEVISGSSGTGFLSPNFVFDAVELY